MASDTPKTTPVPHNDFDPTPEEMAHRLRPLRTLTKGPGWDGTDVAYRGGVKGETTQITYSRTVEGLHKLIERMHEVRGMSDVVREQLTRDVPKDDIAGPGVTDHDDQKLPVFEHLAQLTIMLSRHIEATERNLALTLAALK